MITVPGVGWAMTRVTPAAGDDEQDNKEKKSPQLAGLYGEEQTELSGYI